MHHKRNKPRTRTHHGGKWARGSRKGEAPGYWNILFNNRPKRRKINNTCHKVMGGELDPEGISWELGSRKPHNYYL